jgi:hypothetical protein
MKIFLSQKIQTNLTALGYYQIIGGLIGLGLLISLLTTISFFDALFLTIIISAFILFSFSIYCGGLLIAKKELGIRLSIINQFLQVISFSYAGYSYQYFSGIGFSLGIDFTESFNFIFYLGFSSWKLNINTNSILTTIEINLVAILILNNLFSLQKRIQVEKNKSSIESMISE